MHDLLIRGLVCLLQYKFFIIAAKLLTRFWTIKYKFCIRYTQKIHGFKLSPRHRFNDSIFILVNFDNISFKDN